MATAFAHRLAIIVDAAHVDDARRLSWALGHAPDATSDFRVRLSADGSEPPTAYGLSTAARDDFVALLEIGDPAGLPAVPWADFGLTEAAVMAVLAHLQGPPQRYAVGPSPGTDAVQQFGGLAASLGLTRVVNAEEIS